ncbi:permease for cytosine/purines uracil thiamine allantoin-domain-containing protein [Fusarium acuminatum]|uniref:Permease for cytosine/purines uracil thiamine allantoin-domain-containing protein n=1 Tax=Fusarium acuminatum TaxID=5515 RepID=A0ABZ2WTV7_9HYPO
MTALVSKVHDRLIVKKQCADGTTEPATFLDNDSIRPTPVQDRTWTSVTYSAFWFAATANVSNLYAASTGQSAGLSMWEALGCSFGGQLVAGFLMVLNGRAGSLYRIPFPVACRASFGTWGALWPTFNRAVMSIVWNGVNAVQGAQCLYVFLHAIFPSIADIPDIMGPKSALNSAQMLCFFLYWMINCAFLFIPVPRMKKLVHIKVGVYFAATIAFVAWTLSLSGSVRKNLAEPSTVNGSEKSWLILKFFFLGLASCGTFISNASDLQRYASRPNDVIAGQVFSFPMSNFLVGVFGNLIAAASKSIFGEVVWNPLTTLDMLMEGDRHTSANRAGCALISFAYVYSTVFSAIFENSIPAGNDIAALVPKYITVKRGFFICAVLSYAICPWYLLSSAAVFINFLSSYQIFLSAISGILICDYYLIRRGLFDIPMLYSGHKDSTYHFFHGFNPRAFIVYLIAIAPNFYGFLSQMGVHAPLGIQRFYYVAYPVGLLLAFGSFWLINVLYPTKNIPKLSGWQEPKDFVEDHDGTFTNVVINSSDTASGDQEMGNIEKSAMQKY